MKDKYDCPYDGRCVIIIKKKKSICPYYNTCLNINKTYYNNIKKSIIMKRKLEIEYVWSRDDDKLIPEEHIEALEEDAEERIFEQIKEGYKSGLLYTSVRFRKDIVPDEDKDNGLEYSGAWDINKYNQ